MLDIRGSWLTENYVIKDGPTHRVEGLLFFSAKDWSVLFFMMDEQMKPQFGSSEAGTYTLDGESLLFAHRYHLEAGHEKPLLMEVRDAADAWNELCRVEMAGDTMTIHFPSGNRMNLRRGS
jgi:hypothetical protein